MTCPSEGGSTTRVAQSRDTFAGFRLAGMALTLSAAVHRKATRSIELRARTTFAGHTEIPGLRVWAKAGERRDGGCMMTLGEEAGLDEGDTATAPG